MAKKAKKANKRGLGKGPAAKGKKEICFTIMPFGGWFDTYYETIFLPAIEDAGLEPHRADDLYRPSTITQDIWTYTKRAKLILADLTGKNPNVFYELGMAHALAKPAILVTETLGDVPFDLRALRVIEYSKLDPDWGSALQTKIRKSIAEVLKSPAEAVLPAFLNVKDSTEKPTITKQEKDIVEIKQDLERLQRELQSRSRRVDSPPDRHAADGEDVDFALRQFRSGAPRSYVVSRLRSRRGLSPTLSKAIAELAFDEFDRERARRKGYTKREQEKAHAARKKGTDVTGGHSATPV
jgi:hypothetical protein